MTCLSLARSVSDGPAPEKVNVSVQIMRLRPKDVD